MLSSLKERGKTVLVRAVALSRGPILVNSFGRSGSTVLYDSVIRSSFRDSLIIPDKVSARAVRDRAWDLEEQLGELQAGRVYKTHDLPPTRKPQRPDIRMVYVFADPVDVVASVLRMASLLGERWVYEHSRHLRADVGEIEDIMREDVLGLENHLEAWLAEECFPILYVRYESLWACEKRIGEFLGLPVRLPVYRPRSSKHGEDERRREMIEAAYRRLRNRVASLPDCFTNTAGASRRSSVPV